MSQKYSCVVIALLLILCPNVAISNDIIGKHIIFKADNLQYIINIQSGGNVFIGLKGMSTCNGPDGSPTLQGMEAVLNGQHEYNYTCNRKESRESYRTSGQSTSTLEGNLLKLQVIQKSIDMNKQGRDLSYSIRTEFSIKADGNRCQGFVTIKLIGLSDPPSRNNITQCRIGDGFVQMK